MLRILFACDSFSPIGGGSQKSLELWIKNIKDKYKKEVNFRLLISSYAYKWSKKQLYPFKENLIVNKKSLNLNKILPLLSASYSLTDKTQKSIENFSPHIIQLNEPSFLDILLLKFAKKRKIKICSFFHTQYNKIPSISAKLLAIYQKKIFQASSALLTPSLTTKKYWEKQLKIPVYRVFYPVKKTFFNIKKNTILKKIASYTKQKNLLFIGRLSKEKHVDFLIDLVKELPNTYLLQIVGDGVEKKNLEEKIKNLSLKNRVKLLGWKNQDKIKTLLEQAHFLLLPSSFETFGIVYIEALASFTPVITLKTEVSQEVIPENTGILLDELNLNLWKETILKINQKKYRFLLENIEKNYSYFLKYEETNSTKKLLETYKEILKLKD